MGVALCIYAYAVERWGSKFHNDLLHALCWVFVVATYSWLFFMVMHGAPLITANVGMTLYHGNGPDATGYITAYPGFTHTKKWQQRDATRVANMHDQHTTCRGYPWCMK